MKTNYLILIITLLIYIPANAQKSGKREKLEREIAELEAILAGLEETPTQETPAPKKYSSICYEKTLYTALSPMSNQEFSEFCSREMPNLENFPANAEDHIIASCRQEQGVVRASFCVLSNPKMIIGKEEVGEQTRLSKEKALTKIRNTKKMYQDMIAALDKEIAANNIEIVDNAANLALKHIDLKEAEVFRSKIEELKDKGVEALKGKYGLEGREFTENKVADVVDESIVYGEKLVSFIPGGDKVTNCYLWRIFKSTPELGKMLGNGGASIDIMFQRNEYKKKLEELDKREQELLKAELEWEETEEHEREDIIMIRDIENSIKAR